MPTTLTCLPEPLEAFAAAVFKAMGADDEVAAEVARHLIRANLAGHDSHGVIRIAQYVSDADSGHLQPAARPVVIREGHGTALIDAHRGFGQFSTAFALTWALRRARQYGVAAGAVRHSTHIGRLGEYTERAAAEGLIAFVTAGAAGPELGSVAIYGGRGRFLGTNPWSIGVPGRERAMMYDGATSMIAEGKIRLARAKGTLLPPGCVIDRDGNPTQSVEDFYSGGALMLLGGDAAGHKGYGLSMAAALIGGLSMIGDPDPAMIGIRTPRASAARPGRIGGIFLLAIDPEAFGASETYRTMVDDALGAAKRMPPAPGRAEVLIPGEPEAASRRRRATEGIPIPEKTWQDLTKAAERFDVSLPELRRA